ncbi:Inner membrane transporter YcaM [Trichinella pseudospiralis]
MFTSVCFRNAETTLLELSFCGCCSAVELVVESEFLFLQLSTGSECFAAVKIACPTDEQTSETGVVQLSRKVHAPFVLLGKVRKRGRCISGIPG